MTAVATSSVDAAQVGTVLAVYNALRQVGQVFGVAVLGVLVYAKLPEGASVGAPLPRPQGELFVDGLHTAIWFSGFALLLTAPSAPLSWSPGQPGATTGGQQRRSRPGTGAGSSRDPPGASRLACVYSVSMPDMPGTLTAALHLEEDQYIAQCLEVDAASQGHTIDEALANLAEAVELYLEEVDNPAGHLTATPLVTTFRLPAA